MGRLHFFELREKGLIDNEHEGGGQAGSLKGIFGVIQ